MKRFGRRIWKRITCLALVFAMLLGTGCGETEKEYLSLDVFAGRANYQGPQTGWYAKIVKDKFNMGFNIIAPNVTGGGNLTFESRLAVGKVGDIVITSYENIRRCIDEGVLADISPYIEDSEYLIEYIDEIKLMNEALGVKDGIYFIPTSMSKSQIDQPILYGDRPEIGSFMPWDYYLEIGCPVIETEEDLLNALEEMQRSHSRAANGNKVYAFSLFKDWDVGNMSLASNLARAYGYVNTTDSIFTSADLSKTQRVIEDNSIYYRMLHLYFEANQRGLLDPESGVQSFEDVQKKIQNKQVLFLWWAWMIGSYNDKATNDGYVYVPISSEPLVCDGFSRYGDGYAYAVGQNTESVERIVEYLDWMASPEGMMYYGAGLENIGYVNDEGNLNYTDFSMNAWKYGEELSEEYGGGKYSEGFCQFNDSIVNKYDINPETGESYYSENWTSSLVGYKGVTEKEWMRHFGYSSPAEYLLENDMIQVRVQTGYVPKRESDELDTIREKCAELIKEYSWKMIFAEDEKQFQMYWDDMKELLYENGYNKEVVADMAIIERMREELNNASEVQEAGDE